MDGADKNEKRAWGGHQREGHTAPVDRADSHIQNCLLIGPENYILTNLWKQLYFWST